jgi:ABC-2 type transport system ATP-binding protein
MSGLDPKGMKEMRDVILGLRREGKTIFFNSHILAEVERICDRVGIMHQGRMLKVEHVAELVSGFASKVTLGLGSLGEAALKRVKALKLSMRRENRIWTLEAPHQRLAQVLARLKKAGATHPSVLSYGSPLETAFLKLTSGTRHA